MYSYCFKQNVHRHHYNTCAQNYRDNRYTLYIIIVIVNVHVVYNVLQVISVQLHTWYIMKFMLLTPVLTTYRFIWFMLKINLHLRNDMNFEVKMLWTYINNCIKFVRPYVVMYGILLYIMCEIHSAFYIFCLVSVCCHFCSNTFNTRDCLKSKKKIHTDWKKCTFYRISCMQWYIPASKMGYHVFHESKTGLKDSHNNGSGHRNIVSIDNFFTGYMPY